MHYVFILGQSFLLDSKGVPQGLRGGTTIYTRILYFLKYAYWISELKKAFINLHIGWIYLIHKYPGLIIHPYTTFLRAKRLYELVCPSLIHSVSRTLRNSQVELFYSFQNTFFLSSSWYIIADFPFFISYLSVFLSDFYLPYCPFCPAFCSYGQYGLVFIFFEYELLKTQNREIDRTKIWRKLLKISFLKRMFNLL